MDRDFYEYQKTDSEVPDVIYSFVSIGQSGNIEKLVAFQYVSFLTYNLAMADYEKESGNISDMSNSNNFDLFKLFATIFRIASEFLASNPHSMLRIEGNTPAKQKLYHRIIKNNLQDLQNKFVVLGVFENEMVEIFEPTQEYKSFTIRLKP